MSEVEIAVAKLIEAVRKAVHKEVTTDLLMAIDAMLKQGVQQAGEHIKRKMVDDGLKLAMSLLPPIVNRLYNTAPTTKKPVRKKGKRAKKGKK